MANTRNVGALLQVLHNAPGLPGGLALEALARRSEIALCVGLEKIARDTP
jgi:hypothetical protein